MAFIEGNRFEILVDGRAELEDASSDAVQCSGGWMCGACSLLLSWSVKGGPPTSQAVRYKPPKPKDSHRRRRRVLQVLHDVLLLAGMEDADCRPEASLHRPLIHCTIPQLLGSEPGFLRPRPPTCTRQPADPSTYKTLFPLPYRLAWSPAQSTI